MSQWFLSVCLQRPRAHGQETLQKMIRPINTTLTRWELEKWAAGVLAGVNIGGHTANLALLI